MTEIKKWGYTRRIDLADWVCEYCDKPLGDSGVTTGTGYAHPECDPLTQLLTSEIQQAYDRAFGQARLNNRTTQGETK